MTDGANRRLLVAPARVPASASRVVACIDEEDLPSGPLYLAVLVVERAASPEGSAGRGMRHPDAG